jgi:hypothetical protein
LQTRVYDTCFLRDRRSRSCTLSWGLRHEFRGYHPACVWAGLKPSLGYATQKAYNVLGTEVQIRVLPDGVLVGGFLQFVPISFQQMPVKGIGQREVVPCGGDPGPNLGFLSDCWPFFFLVYAPAWNACLNNQRTLTVGHGSSSLYISPEQVMGITPLHNPCDVKPPSIASSLPATAC